MCEVPSSIHFESFPYFQTGAGEALGIIFGDGGGDGDGDGVGDTDGGETGAGVGEGALGWLLVSVLSSLHHETIVFSFEAHVVGPTGFAEAKVGFAGWFAGWFAGSPVVGCMLLLQSPMVARLSMDRLLSSN